MTLWRSTQFDPSGGKVFTYVFPLETRKQSTTIRKQRKRIIAPQWVADLRGLQRTAKAEPAVAAHGQKKRLRVVPTLRRFLAQKEGFERPAGRSHGLTPMVNLIEMSEGSNPLTDRKKALEPNGSKAFFGAEGGI